MLMTTIVAMTITIATALEPLIVILQYVTGLI